MGKMFLSALVLAGSQAFAYTEMAVSDMSCKKAVEIVDKEKRYYIETKQDGLIPMYMILSALKDPVCPAKTRVYYEIVRTADNPECLVGYSCMPN